MATNGLTPAPLGPAAERDAPLPGSRTALVLLLAMNLLKLLASVYGADSGEIRIAGRLAPFLELGVELPRVGINQAAGALGQLSVRGRQRNPGQAAALPEARQMIVETNALLFYRTPANISVLEV